MNEMSSRHSSPQFKMKTERRKQQPCPPRKWNLSPWSNLSYLLSTNCLLYAPRHLESMIVFSFGFTVNHSLFFIIVELWLMEAYFRRVEKKIKKGNVTFISQFWLFSCNSEFTILFYNARDKQILKYILTILRKIYFSTVRYKPAFLIRKVRIVI